MEYYLAIKRSEILPCVRMWMELECIILSRISQSEKDKYHVISLMWNLRNKTNEHRTKKERETNQNQNQKQTLNYRK